MEESEGKVTAEDLAKGIIKELVDAATDSLTWSITLEDNKGNQNNFEFNVTLSRVNGKQLEKA